MTAKLSIRPQRMEEAERDFDFHMTLKPRSSKGASLNSAYLELWGTITRKPHDVFLASFQIPTLLSFPGIMNSPGSVERGELLIHLLLTHHEPKANPKPLEHCPNPMCPLLCRACMARLPILAGPAEEEMPDHNLITS